MKKHLSFLVILILVIVGMTFFIWDYKYFLNEPLTLIEYSKEDIDNQKVKLKKLWTDNNDFNYYHANLNKTNMDIINFYNKPIKTSTENMRAFYLDTSQEYIYKVDNLNQVQTLIHWKKKMGKVENLATDKKGNIYIQWAKFDRYNSKVIEEGIHKYSSSGKFQGEIFKKSYGDKIYPIAPYGRGFIKNLGFDNDNIYFYYQTNTLVSLYNYNKGLYEKLTFKADEADFKIINIMGNKPDEIYFDTNDSRFAKVNKEGKIVFLRNYLSENKIVNKLSISKDKKIYIEILSDNGVALEKYNGYSFVTIASDKEQIKSIYNEIQNYRQINSIRYDEKLIKIKYLVIFSYIVIILLIIYTMRFLYVYVFQNKVYIAIKQLMLLIPIILIGMLIFVLKTVVGGFGEFSDEIQSGKFHEFNQIIDKKIELVNKRYDSTNYLGDMIDSINLYEDINEDIYSELYNITKISDIKNIEDVQGMYVVIDKIQNDKVYKILDSENNFKMFYPRFAKGENKYFRAASKGDVVDAVGTGETYIFTMKPIYNSKGEISGIYQVGMYYEGYRKNLDMKVFAKSIVGIMITTLVIVFAVVFITYIILKSLVELTKTVKEVSAGNLDTQLSINSKDEIEDLSDAFNSMTSNIREYIDDMTKLSNAYYRFVPQEILEILDKESVSEVELGEHKKFHMCVLNVGVEDFYEISKKMKAEEKFRLINEYLKIIGPIIRRHRGVIEKYLDRGIIALFPKSGKDAIEAAKDIVREVDRYGIYKTNDLPVADVRIGIHKGPVLIGIIGEEKRLQSSIVSDNANLAGNISKKAKSLWANIVVTEDVIKDINDNTYLNRYLGKVSLSDREESISLYDIYEADHKEIRQLKDMSKYVFETSVKNFKIGRFYDARSGFVKILDKNIDDSAAREYFYQSDNNYRNGVEKDWNESLKL